MYLQYFYTNQTVAKTVIKAVPICNKKKWEMSRFWKYISKKALHKCTERKQKFQFC